MNVLIEIHSLCVDAVIQRSRLSTVTISLWLTPRWEATAHGAFLFYQLSALIGPKHFTNAIDGNRVPYARMSLTLTEDWE